MINKVKEASPTFLTVMKMTCVTAMWIKNFHLWDHFSIKLNNKTALRTKPIQYQNYTGKRKHRYFSPKKISFSLSLSHSQQGETRKMSIKAGKLTTQILLKLFLYMQNPLVISPLMTYDSFLISYCRWLLRFAIRFEKIDTVLMVWSLMLLKVRLFASLGVQIPFFWDYYVNNVR